MFWTPRRHGLGLPFTMLEHTLKGTQSRIIGAFPFGHGAVGPGHTLLNRWVPCAITARSKAQRGKAAVRRAGRSGKPVAQPAVPPSLSAGATTRATATRRGRTWRGRRRRRALRRMICKESRVGREGRDARVPGNLHAAQKWGVIHGFPRAFWPSIPFNGSNPEPPFFFTHIVIYII